MKLFDDSENASDERVSVTVTAVGGCGLALLERLREMLGDSISTLAIDTDRAQLFDSNADRRLLLGEELTGGDGTGGDVRLGERCLSGNNMQVRDLMGGTKANLIIGGLGGGTASALMAELAKISRSAGVLTLVLATRPFAYEEDAKTILAKRKIHSLVRSADSVFLLNNEVMAGAGSGRLAAKEAIRRSDAAVLETISGVIEFLTPRKRMLLDFGTIKSHLTRLHS